jgi:hypothetical protein
MDLEDIFGNLKAQELGLESLGISDKTHYDSLLESSKK